MKKRFLFIALMSLLVLVTLLLASCGGDDTTTTTTQATSTAKPAVTENPLLVTAYDKPNDFVILPALEDIKISKADINKEVDKYITELLGQMGKTDLRPVAEGVAAVKGDAVNIHYTGRAKDPSVTLSETTLKGMTNADQTGGYDLVLGSDSFIPGFEDQLIGAKTGDRISVDVTFPKDYSEELSEVAVIFEVTVNEVKRATVGEKNIVNVNVSYTLNGATANGDIASLLEEHIASLDMAKLDEKFDELFDTAAIAEALLGKCTFVSVSVPLSLTAEQAKEFGYETALELTASIEITDIVIYPETLTDEDINAFTNGEYKTAEAFRQYAYDYYKVNTTYLKIGEIITYKDIPADVYKALYDTYYDASLQNQLGDISKLTEEELAAKLTETVKATAEKFAKENAEAEWQDKMMMSYLTKLLDFTLSEETYQAKLKELYEQNAMMLYYYYGITSPEAFEEAYGKDYFVFQFTNEAVLELVAEKVTYID